MFGDEKMIENMIEGMDHVRDAGVVRRETTISIAVVVDYAVNVETSKSIGDNAVRISKSLLGGEQAPGKSIGKGTYTYQVGLYRPNEQEIALGTKASDDDHLRWWSELNRSIRARESFPCNMRRKGVTPRENSQLGRAVLPIYDTSYRHPQRTQKPSLAQYPRFVLQDVAGYLDMGIIYGMSS